MQLELLGWSDDSPPASSHPPLMGDPSSPTPSTYQSELDHADLDRTMPVRGMFDQPPKRVANARGLHKKRLAGVPQPCTDGDLPPWITMSGSKRNRGVTRSKSTAEAESVQATLRRLRGAYLPLHAEEQKRIPMMASRLNVEQLNQQHETMIGDRLQNLASLNRELHYRVDSFWRRRRTWSRRGGKRKPRAEPESAVAALDLPRPSLCNEQRNMYRSNAKLVPPFQSGFDTSCCRALYVHEPHIKPQSKNTNTEAMILAAEQEVVDAAEMAAAARQRLNFIPDTPAQLRLKIYQMGSEMKGILKEAQAMAPPQAMLT